ncbi:hypothetical protein BMETH_2009_0 [methanotrophic bacterial endosymbiont of Bathymodiolus sp.]|nr:hypothetical protein BMETH_2009_0 [methanotrophic bacterial endosymbiont of Bathymodiolus sp.]
MLSSCLFRSSFIVLSLRLLYLAKHLLLLDNKIRHQQLNLIIM